MAAAAAPEEGPVMSLISKRLRKLRKKLGSDPTIAAAIRELEKLRRPLFAAVSDEIRLAASLKGVAVDGLQTSAYISSDSNLTTKNSTKLHSAKKRKSLQIANDDIEDKSPEKATEMSSAKKHKSNTEGSLTKQTNATNVKRNRKFSTIIEESDPKELENQNQDENLSQNFKNLESLSNTKEGREVAPQLGKPNGGVEKQPNKNALWAQKSLWTDLVGGTNASFSISQLLPNTKFEEKEQVDQTKNWFAAKTINKPNEMVNKLTDSVAVSDVGFKSSLQVVKERAIRAPLKYSIGDTCSFMRSDASMKEWKSIKAALSSSRRKKIDKTK